MKTIDTQTTITGRARQSGDLTIIGLGCEIVGVVIGPVEIGQQPRLPGEDYYGSHSSRPQVTALPGSRVWRGATWWDLACAAWSALAFGDAHAASAVGDLRRAMTD